MSQAPAAYQVVDETGEGETGEGKTASDRDCLGACRRGDKKCIACAACGGCCGLFLLSLILFVVISNLTATPVSDEPSLFLDGWTQTPVPRKLINGSTSELLYEWSIDDVGIKIVKEGNASVGIVLPMNKLIQATFLRTNHMTGVVEYGIARQFWGPNPISVFGERVKYGLMEKMHVLSREGPSSQRSIEHVRQEKRDRGSLTRWLARRLRTIRGVLLHMFNFQPTGLIPVFADEDIFASGVAFVQNSSRIPTTTLAEGMAARIKDLDARKSSGLNHTKYEHSACNCFHLDEAPTVNGTEDGLYLPLDTMLTSHRGQTVFTPREELGFNTGVAVLKVDAFSKKLRLYYVARAETELQYFLGEAAEPPVFFVAPADFGSTPYDGPDAREGGSRSWVGWTLYWLYSSIPIDYEFLHLDPAELCPESVHERLNGTFSSTDMVAFVRSEKTLAQGFHLARLFARSTDCSTEYLGAGSNEESPSLEVDGLHGYDFLEAGVWSHAFLEVPQRTRAAALTHREWNNFAAPV